jgi:hypothetical protein
VAILVVFLQSPKLHLLHHAISRVVSLLILYMRHNCFWSTWGKSCNIFAIIQFADTRKWGWVKCALHTTKWKTCLQYFPLTPIPILSWDLVRFHKILKNLCSNNTMHVDTEWMWNWDLPASQITFGQCISQWSNGSGPACITYCWEFRLLRVRGWDDYLKDACNSIKDFFWPMGITIYTFQHETHHQSMLMVINIVLLEVIDIWYIFLL